MTLNLFNCLLGNTLSDILSKFASMDMKRERIIIKEEKKYVRGTIFYFLFSLTDSNVEMPHSLHKEMNFESCLNCWSSGEVAPDNYRI